MYVDFDNFLLNVMLYFCFERCKVEVGFVLMEVYFLSKLDVKICYGLVEVVGVVLVSDYEEDDESLDYGKVGCNEEVCFS